jgi:glycosyltransferase involved in cell wall biosynthesis
MTRSVLIISQLPPPHHGSTAMTRVLLDSLDALGFDSHLVDRRFSKTVGEVGRITLKKAFASAGLAIRLTSALIRHRPDSVVFFMTNRTASFLADLVLSWILRFWRVPVIGYIHTQGFMSLASRGKLWDKAVRSLLNSASTVVCLSAALEDDVAHFLTTARVVSIPNTPVDPPETIVNQGPKNIVLFLSNLIPEKGIGDFALLADRAGQNSYPFQFVAAGAPTDAFQIARLVEGASHNLNVIGAVDAVEKWDLLGQAAVLVFPSVYPFEAQPLVIIEAMAAGVPVVAYRVGGIADVIVDGATGVLVDPGDVESLWQVVADLLCSPDVINEMAVAARAEYVTGYARSAYEGAWYEVLSR